MLSLHYFEGRGVPRDGTKGVRYQAGVGVAKDAERAKKYFTRACDGGPSIACERIRADSTQLHRCSAEERA